MADQTTPDLTPTPQPTLMNDPTARAPDGTIKDQSPPPTTTSTPTEAKPDGTEPPKPAELGPDGKPKAGDKPAESVGAPEKYEAFTAPEGYTLDAAAIEAATPIFRELNLSQAQSQKLVDFYNERMIAAAKAPIEAVETMREGWRTSVKSDPELSKAVSSGKVGLDAVKADIGKAISMLDPALATEFKSAMDLTGAGDHPAFVKAFWKLSQALNEGSHVNGGGPSPHGQSKTGVAAKPSAAQSMYPGLPTSAQS